MTNKELMRRAILLSKESVRKGGGPFGAVIARNGEIIAEGSNCVTIDCLIKCYFFNTICTCK